MLTKTMQLILLITVIVYASLLSADDTSKPTLSGPAAVWSFSQMPNKASLRGTAIIQNSLWVTGDSNSVFVSQDSGETWQNKSVPTELNRDFRDIELFNDKTAIVMSAGSGELSTLYKTNDGGNSWQVLYQNNDKLGFFNSIAFWNEKQGLLMGDPVDGFYVIKKTTDGGKTWRRITVNNLPSILPKESAFAASGSSIIVGNSGKAWIATGGFSASVYISNDYGETWQRDSVPLYQDTQTSGGYSVALNNLGQTFVIGGDYLQRHRAYSNMARLNDELWEPINTGSIGLRTAMSCQDKICLTTGKTSTDISFDAGNSWQVLINKEAEGVTQGFYSLASDDYLFIAAGAEGKVGVLSFKEKVTHH